MQSHTCPLCLRIFHGRHAHAAHLKNIWKRPDDPSRCDYNDNSDFVPPLLPADVVVTRPVTPLHELAQRKRAEFDDISAARQAYTITANGRVDRDYTRSRDLTAAQDEWQRFLMDTKSLCSDQFWKFFLQIHTFTGVAIDTSLSSAKRTFLSKNSSDWKQFPPSKRELLTKIKKLNPFWHQIWHSCSIDLSKFRLPSGTKSLEFHFIDPLWGWLRAARRQQPNTLQWKPRAQNVLCPFYGGGVQYGESFAQACQSCPAGSYPMCVGLHWDGTSGRGLSSSPICIEVANTNCCDSSTQFCLGYMPHVPDECKPEWAKLPKATTVKFYIRQQCASAILRVLEHAARDGVKCRLQNNHGVEVKRLLFPRILSMNFDQVEAQLFFGMQNRMDCSKCIRRKGYSAFRKSRLQDGTQVRVTM